MARKATIERKTKETDIKITLNLDGTGVYSIRCGVPFMDHMFSHIAKHGFFDLTVKATGDTHIDDHHTVEDLGIAFGQALKKALGASRGIRRYGEATVPMDETLAEVVMDLSAGPISCTIWTCRRSTSSRTSIRGLPRTSSAPWRTTRA